MRRFVLFCLLCSLLPLLPVVAGAEVETFFLEDIVVRGEKESPHEASLNMREVRESSAKDIGEALKQVAGMTYVRKAAIANDPILRGFQKDNINVLVDGVRLHGACPARMDPPSFHYDFAEVEQIRIIKGPYDLENPGSLGGLVETITKQPKAGPGGEATLSYGSYESINASGVLSYGAGKVDGLAGAAYKRSDVPESGSGRLITDIYPSTSPNRYRSENRDGTAYEIETVWLKLGLKPTADSRSELSYSYQNAENVLYPYLKMDAEFDRTHRVNWTYRKENLTSSLKDLTLQAYFDRVRHVMTDALRASSLPSPMVTRSYMMRSDAATDVLGAKARISFSEGDGVWINGVDYYQRRWETLNERAKFTPANPYTIWNMIPDVSTDNFGFFSRYEIPMTDKVSMKGGIRADMIRIKAHSANNATAVSRDTSFTEISANIQAIIRPLKGFEIFAGFGRGVRAPDPEELYINVPAAPPAVTWIGNPNLDPTVNHQVDLGVKYASGKYYLTGTLFYSRLTDYINFYKASPAMKSYQNVDADMWGGEFSSRISLPMNFYLTGVISYTEGRNRNAGRPLSEIPPLTGLLSMRFDNARWFVEMTENMTAKQDRVDNTIGEEQTGGWATTDVKAGITLAGWRLYAGVNNLLDKDYVRHLSYQRDPFASVPLVKVPEDGRNFYVTAAFEY